jgi:hypothetical protein
MQNLSVAIPRDPFTGNIIFQLVHIAIEFSRKAKLAQNKWQTDLNRRLSLQKNNKVKSLTLVFLLFLIISCNNSASNNQTTKTQADSLMDEVMEGHNKGMAKVSKLNEAKNKIQHVIDSISKLPADLQKSSVQYRMQLDSVFNMLTFANYSMDKWMNEFNMDSLNNNKKEQVKYLQSERSKISNVNEVMIRSLKNADSLLNKK